MPEHSIKAALESKIQAAIQDGYQTFISGMARGVNFWAVEIVHHLRAEGNQIRLVCAVPYKGFKNHWSTKWPEQYQRIVDAADFVRYRSPGYNPACFQSRNKWMVDLRPA